MILAAKVYFSGWFVVIALFLALTVWIGWEGFVGLYLLLGVSGLVMDREPTLFFSDIAYELALGPFVFMTVLSEKFDR